VTRSTTVLAPPVDGLMGCTGHKIATSNQMQIHRNWGPLVIELATCGGVKTLLSRKLVDGFMA
jgi:hypothetical protein